MNKSLKPCDRNNNGSLVLTDRLTTLPVELLIRILSLLPTKDGAATRVLSKTMLSVFPWVTTLDFDDSPITYCKKEAYRVECLTTFVDFVDSVIQSHKSQYLTRFRLKVGQPVLLPYRWNPNKHRGEYCKKSCFPDLSSTKITAWISSSIIRCGLKELDLLINVREEGDAQLPPEIFTCQTLEVLKLDVNLGLDRASTTPSFCLPNLKVLVLFAAIIPDDGLLTRLVSSCPLLEDLTVEATWKDARFISISSPSLRRLSLYVCNINIEECHASDFVLIHAPNLEYLSYVDDLALDYSITHMKWLVKAKIKTDNVLLEEDGGPQMLSLMRALSSVQHLELSGDSWKDLNVDEALNQLPLFHNLKCLKLNYRYQPNYQKVLWAILNCSPVLETLVFPGGFQMPIPMSSKQMVSSTTLPIVPSGRIYHVKRIVVGWYFGCERELDLIRSLLRHAFFLEELVISLCWMKYTNPIALESTLRKLPRASITASIQVLLGEHVNPINVLKC